MRPRSGWFAAVALAAALAVAGCSAAATPSPSPTATGMPAGNYVTKLLQPQLSYTVPAGWMVAGDEADFFSIRPAVSDLVGIYVFRGPQAMSQDASCPDTAEPGVETSSVALSAWIRGLKGLKAGTPRLATVGSLRGTELDVEIAEGWKQSCSFANGLPTVSLFLGEKATYHWVMYGTEKMRLTILDGPGGKTIVIAVDATEGALFDDIAANAAPIIKTFVFKG